MTTQDAIVTIQTGPFIFVKHLENVWVEQDGRFRLERQEFDFDDDQLTHDWGVWDTLTENWAHPETGYARKQQALNAFLNAQKARETFAKALANSSPKLWREEV